MIVEAIVTEPGDELEEAGIRKVGDGLKGSSNVSNQDLGR